MHVGTLGDGKNIIPPMKKSNGGTMNNIAKLIEKFIEYGRIHLGLYKLDAIYVRNQLLHLLEVDAPYEGEIDVDFIKNLTVPDVLIDELKEYLVSKNTANPELICVQVMGMLTPTPSFVGHKVLELEKEQTGKGLDYLYDLSIKNNYIQKTAIDKNIYFKKEYENNFLEITINLSKPEKNNKDIAKLLSKPSKVSYPKCPLCIDNIGYFGSDTQAGRENIRYIPVFLNNEFWFIQYSPYSYFDHHAIVINEKHNNMVIDNSTFLKLLEFVKQYPTFFVGSNADLPIVGGSILNHEHYQCGLHLLPVFYSKDRKVYLNNESVKVSILDWYNSVIRIESKEISKIVEFCSKIFEKWKNYEDKEASILPFTNETRHNTITPIARKIGDTYQMNLILRNNRCDEQYPDGIFHAHPEHHNIKHEGIGLIEAMGLFILPARLKRQMSYVEDILSSEISVEKLYQEHEDLLVHKNMIDSLISSFGRNLSKEEAHKKANDFLANTCKEILCNTAVFKNDEKGQKSFDKFMKEVF